MSVKKWLCAGVLSAAVVPLSACTGFTGEPAAERTTDEVFLEVLESEFTDPGEMHIKVAHVVCDAFDDGLSWRQVGHIMLTELPEWTPEQSGAVTGAGVAAYCPHNSGLLPQ